MKTTCLILLFLALCSLYPVPSHALDVYVVPSAPTDVDSVSLVGTGCNFSCQSQHDGFGCSELDAHTYRIDAMNYGAYCLPEILGGECFTCSGCAGGQIELGRCQLGVLAPGHYVVQIFATIDLGQPVYSEISFNVSTTPTGVRTTPSPTVLSVAPNPFASSTRIEFALSGGAHATLEVFDVRGSRVRTLVDESIDAPGFAVQWDGRDANGRQQPSGIYFARLIVDGRPADSRRIVLIR